MAVRAVLPLTCITCVVLPLTAEVLSTADYNTALPQTEGNGTLALSEVGSQRTGSFLSNLVLKVAYRGLPNIPLEDVSVEVDNITMVHLMDLRLRSSPVHVTSVTSDLRLMNLQLHANIRHLEVTGNYIASIETMNDTSRQLIIENKGSVNLRFQNLTVSGPVALGLIGDRLQVHTVNLLYKPTLVILRMNYTDVNGVPQVAEERGRTVEGAVKGTIYADVVKRLNIFIREELNKIMRNGTVSEPTGNSSETEISFRPRPNNHIRNLNDFVDHILNVTEEDITDQVSIPDYVKSFEKKLGFIPIRGIFKAEGGWLRNLKTLRRTSDVTAVHVGKSIVVTANVSLQTLEFGYARYSAKLLDVGPGGTLTATVGSNSETFRSRVEYVGGNCTITVQDLRVQEIGGLQLKLTGLHPFNWILSKVATPFANRCKFNIAKAIEETVADTIREKLEGFDCGQNFAESAVRGAVYSVP